MNTPTYNEILTELRTLALRPSGGELSPVIVNEQDGSPMVLVPAGSFTMGDDLDKESPQHTQSGNVMEWCSVWHEETVSGNASTGEESLRQERGCCWRYPDKFAFRCSQRSFVVSKAVNDFRGFRMVLPVHLSVSVQETFVYIRGNAL